MFYEIKFNQERHISILKMADTYRNDMLVANMNENSSEKMEHHSVAVKKPRHSTQKYCIICRCMGMKRSFWSIIVIFGLCWYTCRTMVLLNFMYSKL